MANGNGGVSTHGDLVLVSESSDQFHKSILGPLQNAYLYEESKQSFLYKSAFLIKNATLQEKYETFRVQRRVAGYSEKDLKESYGFLLFDDKNRANKLGETGVVTGNSTCTTLGDPRKGVYVSKYSDCLDINRWYHGKTGYIAIIKLTQGRVKSVLENYTQNLTVPSEGFDCHVSEQLAAVSANTSSFLAFERTQYYMYERLDVGSNRTAESPSHACPFAIVSFSYGDTKATPSVPQEKSEEKKAVLHYLPWRGQLQICSQLFNVGLKSTTGALMPAKLPAVVKVNRVVSMVDLREFVPKAVFETCFSGEVSLDGMCCSLYELVPSEAEDTSLALLTQELMTKDLALAVQLNDGGFLIVLHSSHFLTYDDAKSNTTEVLQGMFVFPDSRAIQRDTNVGWKKPTISSEILQVLPALNYAESEVEKGCTDQTGELCVLLEQHIQSYAALINPGLAASPSKEASIFPDQYDVPDALTYLYSAPKWSSRTWQSFKSYQTQPGSFQLPVSRAMELLEAGQEERRDDPDDEVYVFPPMSSPEEAPATAVTMCLEARLEAQESPTHADTPVDSRIASVRAQHEADIMPQNDVAHILQYGGSSIDELSKTELIVSITSAKDTTAVLDRGQRVKSAVPVAMHCQVHLSSLSPTERQIAVVNSEKGDKARKPIGCSEVSNTPKMDGRKRPRGYRKGRRISPRSSAQTSSLPEAKSVVDAESSLSENHGKASQPSDHPEMDNSSLSESCDKAGQLPDHQEIDYSSLSEKCKKVSQSSDDEKMNDSPKIDWRKLPRRRRKCAKLSSKCKRILRSAGVKVKEKDPDLMQSVVVVEPEFHPLRRKTERWDLKPVITECGRIFVPHGSKNCLKHMVSLKDRPKAAGREHCPDKMTVDGSVEALETGQDSRPVSQMKQGQMATIDTMDVGGEVNSGQSKESDGRDVSQTSKPDTKESSLESCMTGADATDSRAPEPIQKQHTDGPVQVQDTQRKILLLSKLRSLLPLKAKRKQFQGVPSDETQPGHAQGAEHCVEGTEPSVKRSKADVVAEKLEMDFTEGDQDTTVDTENVSKTRTLDPLLAQALCLTPKEFADRDSSNVQHPVTPQTTSDKPAQPLQSTPSQVSGRGRMKTLKKRQNVSRESVKKKWWLHFHTPASLIGEKPESKACTRNSSVRKNLKEKLSITFPPTDALTLLADLALCASNGQVPQQPDPALEGKLDSSSETRDLVKDGLEPESVLHALLKQPTPSHALAPKSPSPKGHVGNKERVVLITKEHAYSMPPSFPLLLGLSGAPFQVSPLSGSAGLQRLRQNTNSDGARALRANLSHEDKCQGSRSTTESLSKAIVRRKRFRRSRTFIEEDGSVRVTRLWKENYDFGLDSKFTNDLKDKTVIRALHGTWDFSIQDTTEQVQLIVHMWIGLFYSRSTARFFHLDSSLPCLEDIDCLEMSDGTAPKQTTPDAETSSSAPVPTRAVDLRKKKTPVLNQESVVLDLSLMKPKKLDLTSDTQVNREELPVSHEQTETIKGSEELEPSLGLCESSTSHLLPAENQPPEICREKADVIYNICMLDDNRSSHKSQSTSNLQKTSNLGHSDGTSSVLCEEMGNVYVPQENTQPTMQAGEESKAFSLTQGEKIHEEEDDHHPVNHFTVSGDKAQIEMKDGADFKGQSPTVVHTGGHMSDKALPMLYDGHGSREDKLNAECTGNVSLAEKPPQVVNEKEACNTSLSEVQCANGTDDQTMPAQDYNSPLEMLPTEHGGDVSVDQSLEVNVDEATSELIHEVTSDMIHEVTSEMIDEATSEMIDEATSEVIGEVTSEMIGEVTSEMIGEVTSEMIGEVTSEMIGEVTSEMIGEVTSEMIGEVTSEMIGEVTSEMIGEVTSEMIGEVTSEMMGDNLSRDEVLRKKAAYPVCADNAPVEGIVGESQNELKSDLIVLSCNSEDKDVRLNESEREVYNHASEITSINKQLQPSQGKTLETLKAQIEVCLVGEADVGQDIASTQISLPKEEISEIMHIKVEIPLIGIDSPWQKTLHTQVSQDNTQEVVQGPKEMQLIKHTEPVYTAQENSEKAPLFAGEFTGFVHSDSNRNMVSKERKSDNRCPTPTVNEKPHDDTPCPDQLSSTSASGRNNRVCNIFTGNNLSRSSTPTQDEWPLDQESTDSGTLNNVLLPEPGVNHRLTLLSKLDLSKEQVIPDHKLRTISPTEKQPCKPSHMNESSHMETTEMHIDQEQALNSTATYSKGDDLPDNSCVASTSTKHQLHTKPIHNTPKSSLEETARPTIEHYLSGPDGLKDISWEQDSSHSSDGPFGTADFVQAVIDQARGRPTTQDSAPCEIRSHSQRPVMAVRPSKSDESRPTQVTVHTHTMLSAAILSRHTDGSSAVSEDMNENEQEDTELCSKTNWVSDDQDVIRRFNLDKAKLDLIDALYQCQETDEQKFENISNIYKIGQTAEGQVEIKEEDAQVATSAVVLDCKEKRKIHDVGPSTSSIKRTVYNSGSKGSNSLVDELSERCSESDLTLSSMEHESLIFSERMNQLMKRNKTGTSYSKTNSHGRTKHCRSEAATCPDPVSVCFSSLQEQEDPVEHWESLPSLVAHKIKVDMPERRGLADTTGGEKTLHLHRPPYEKGNPVAHDVVSDMTAKCARSYHAMMDGICASKKLSSKTESSKTESGLSKVRSSGHADFCGQMKKEMYNVHSNLDSLRQSCRSKSRFYILVTSADAFFEETKELLKAEGHTEVQPSQFFLVEKSPSPLMVILRNEDIAEHICEVPHLLELKKSPDVLFAGIDQPDDVVSLTHQELFSRGGFVVFEGAALETLSLCNMKKFSQFLEELSKKGKWKWLLHYRDSRQLKGNARLTAEAMEKKRFIDCCQEAGMVEVLPYHECDAMSRDRPNYSSCLARLQVQNISARFPVFITDTTADSAFGKNGILTMNINSFLLVLISQSDACTIS